MKRINEFLETETTIINYTNKDTKIQGDIEFNNVSFRYPDTGIQALKNVSFKINENETLGILEKPEVENQLLLILLLDYMIEIKEKYLSETEILKVKSIST